MPFRRSRREPFPPIPAIVSLLIGLAPLTVGPSSAYPQSADSANVTLLSHFPIQDYDPWVADVWGYADVSGEYALVCQGNALHVVDVTDPELPVSASIVAAAGRDLKDCKTWETHAYCALEDGGIQVIDLSDPYDAQDVGLIGSPNGYHNVFIDERGLLYATGFADDIAFEIYDLTIDDVAPPRIASYGTEYVHDINVVGDWVLACYIGGGYFEIVDVANPHDPSQLAVFTHDGPLAPHSGWIARDHRHVYTCDETNDGHLIVWDTSNLPDVQIVDEYQVGSGSVIHNVQLQDDLAYVSYYDQGVRVLRTANPTQLVEVGYWAADGVTVWGVYPHTESDNFYFNDMTGADAGLYVARYDRPIAGVSRMGPAAGRPRLRIWPNPSRGEVALSLGAGRTPSGTFTIFDAEGRRVRQLRAQRDVSGGLGAIWDGRNYRGAASPPGIYFAASPTGERGKIHLIR